MLPRVWIYLLHHLTGLPLLNVVKELLLTDKRRCRAMQIGRLQRASDCGGCLQHGHSCGARRQHPTGLCALTREARSASQITLEAIVCVRNSSMSGVVVARY